MADPLSDDVLEIIFDFVCVPLRPVPLASPNTARLELTARLLRVSKRFNRMLLPRVLKNVSMTWSDKNATSLLHLITSRPELCRHHMRSITLLFVSNRRNNDWRPPTTRQHARQWQLRKILVRSAITSTPSCLIALGGLRITTGASWLAILSASMISLFLLTCSASTEGYNTIWPCLSAGLVCLLTVAVRSLLAGTGFLARVPQSDRLFFAAALIASGIALSTEQILEPLRDHRQQIRMRAISQILRSLPALEHLSVVDQLNWEHEDILPFDALDGLELEHHPKSLTYSNDFSSSYAALASLLSHLDGIRCLRLRKMGQIVTAANASERRAFWIWPERRPPLRLRRLTELYLDQADLSWQDICALVPPTLSALSVRRPNLPGFESIFNHCCGSLRVLLVHHAETIAPTINFSKLQRLQAASFSHVLIGPIIGSAPDEVSTAQDLQNERIEWLQLASQAALLSALDKAQGLRHLRIDVPVSYSTGYNLAVFAKRMPRLRRMTLLSAGSSASEHVETLIEACHAIDVPVDIRETVVYNAQ